jgi:uncharacterized protein
VVRTTLTGTHLLLSGELETDVTKLVAPYGVDDVLALVEAKTKGEKAPLPAELSALWRQRTTALFAKLDDARDRSELPAEAPAKAVQALEAWLLELRRTRW